MTQDFKIFRLVLGHFVLLVPFEISSCYPDINGSYWFSKISMDHSQNFQTKTYDLNDFDTFFLDFSTRIFGFHLYLLFFHNHKTYCGVLLIAYA